MMKSFFVCMMIVAVLAVGYDFWGSLADIAHNQYLGRHELLDTSHPQPDHRSAHLGLTPKELAACDPSVADAYRQAVYDGYKLGTGYFGKERRYLALAGLLLLTGWCGIIASRKKNKDAAQPTAAASPSVGKYEVDGQ